MTRSLFNPLPTRAAAAQNMQGTRPILQVLHTPPQGGSLFLRHGDCTSRGRARGADRATSGQAGIK